MSQPRVTAPSHLALKGSSNYDVCMLLGYARVSTTDQSAAMQIKTLVEYGVEEKYIFIDHLSGARQARERPGMTELLNYAREGDEVICWRIDRLGRSLIDVLNTVMVEDPQGNVTIHEVVDERPFRDDKTPTAAIAVDLMDSLATRERAAGMAVLANLLLGPAK